MIESLRIIVKPQICSGCLSCTTSCSMANEFFVSLASARVRIELNPFDVSNKIFICRQCAKAPCVRACPIGAITLREDGAWVIDYERCDKCMKCIDSCPFDAIFWSQLIGKVIKCELCDGDPQCVQACGIGALSVQMTSKEKQ